MTTTHEFGGNPISESLGASAPGPPAALEVLEALVTADLALGRLRPVLDYLALFPGREEVVAVRIAEAAVELDERQGVLEEGRRIRHFRIERCLGAGGFGTVWLAHDENVNRKVALKVLMAGGGAAGDALRFRREVELSGQINHPNVCGVHDSFLEGDRLCIVMQYVEGETLAHRLDRLKRSGSGTLVGSDPDSAPHVNAEIDSILLFFERVARGIDAAHSVGIIHRDLKPANLMVRLDGEPMVLDFGMARSRDDVTLTLTGELCGTAAYMSPEQLATADLTLDARTDTWSIGVCLYETLTLRRPFEAVTREGVFHAIQSRDPDAPRRLNPALSKDLATVIGTALEKNRDRRYQTALDLAEELRRVREFEPIRARPASGWTKMRRWAQRNPAAAGLSTALSLAVLAGLVTAWILKERADESAAAAHVAREEAERTSQDVLSLSAQENLDSLVARAATLWPAHPAALDDLRRWMEEASELIHGRPADPARGLKPIPSLDDHRAQLAKLRQKARPVSEKRRLIDLSNHPRAPELRVRRSYSEWLSRMLGLEPWPTSVEIEAEMARENLSSDPLVLHKEAWMRADPDQPPYGEEVKALILARRAFASASPAERPRFRSTLAWACLKRGLLDQAEREDAQALAEAGEGERRELEAWSRKLHEGINRWRGPEALDARRVHNLQVRRYVAELEAVVSERRSWEFDDSTSTWWHARLSELVTDLELLIDPNRGLLGDNTTEAWGPSVGRRYEFARTIESLSLNGGSAERLWKHAIAAISLASIYRGIELSPQLGLLPIGSDPDSGLWEFVHLETGVPPIRRDDGSLELSEEMGIVFVLIPGGGFLMGAQATLADGINYDPFAQIDEGPVHHVQLSPYFISKFEMTQAQWRRATGRNPSEYNENRYFEEWNSNKCRWSGLHPVERVSWLEAFDVVARMGLSLPSEAQWEYACRAGSTTIYWSGDSPKDLRNVANLSDAYAKSHGHENSANWETVLDDGNTVHAPVGRYRANRFGLHDVHGNVSEWVLDVPEIGFYSRTHGVDPTAAGDKSKDRLTRGGNFRDPASALRSAARVLGAPDATSFVLGLRPARKIDP
jgi:serine/threonine protein kinase/formylglycine-generating enzyme required for sulfatase activity